GALDRAQRRAGAGALFRRVRLRLPRVLSPVLSALPGVLSALYPAALLCRAAAGLLRATASAAGGLPLSLPPRGRPAPPPRRSPPQLHLPGSGQHGSGNSGEVG